MRLPLSLLCAAAIVFCGCGTPGAPRPPSLGIPKPVSDLQATRKGAIVTLSWTAPIETTDGELVKRSGKMVVMRALVQGAPGQPVGELPLYRALKDLRPEKMTATDSLAGLLQSGATPDFVFYGVQALSGSGKGAGLSNQVSVPMVATLPAPQQVTAKPVPRGVELTWEPGGQVTGPARFNPQFLYRIMRRPEGAQQPVTAGQVEPGTGTNVFIDTGIQWEQKYQYWITPITLWHGDGQKGEVEGGDSVVVSVFAHDSFPPAVPSGLQAVFSGVVQRPGIDLTWTPNTDEDLAGYNVYRSNGQGPAVKINTELVKTPAFHDSGLQPGMTYTYSVSAVDLRGNESGHSQEAAERVPKE